jgi:hypothetical protein
MIEHSVLVDLLNDTRRQLGRQQRWRSLRITRLHRVEVLVTSVDTGVLASNALDSTDTAWLSNSRGCSIPPVVVIALPLGRILLKAPLGVPVSVDTVATSPLEPRNAANRGSEAKLFLNFLFVVESRPVIGQPVDSLLEPVHARVILGLNRLSQGGVYLSSFGVEFPALSGKLCTHLCFSSYG